MADPTSLALAQLFQLDLSAAPSDEAASQIVVNTVQEMAVNMHDMNSKLIALGCNDYNEDGEEEEIEPANEQEENEVTQQQHTAVAASLDETPKFSNTVIKMAAKGRIGEVRGLVAEGYLTPAAGKKILDKFATDKAIGLSLSMEDSDGYEEMVEVIRSNGPVVVMGERTGAQSVLQQMSGELQLSNDEISDPTKNPLMAEATKRFEAAKTAR